MAVDRDCMSDRIRRVLAERIISGQLAPGERLVEMRIAEEFRTSQAPVREALREPLTLRLVESEPDRGTRGRGGRGRGRWARGGGLRLPPSAPCWSRPPPSSRRRA